MIFQVQKIKVLIKGRSYPLRHIMLFPERMKKTKSTRLWFSPSRLTHDIPFQVGLAFDPGFCSWIHYFLIFAWGTTSCTSTFLPLQLLAGTIIFGGGPVVIPLSPHDFLLGLKPCLDLILILQSISVLSVPKSVIGAILGFLGIFTPGLWLSVAFQSFPSRLRKRRGVVSVLRGVNATAVGFILQQFTDCGRLDILLH